MGGADRPLAAFHGGGTRVQLRNQQFRQGQAVNRIPVDEGKRRPKSYQAQSRAVFANGSRPLDKFLRNGRTHHCVDPQLN